MHDVRSLVVATLCLLNTAAAQTKIHKCTDSDGSIVYSQLPCSPKKAVDPEKTEPDENAATTEPVSEVQEPSVAESPPESLQSEANRAACKKRYRDAIDAIDAEIGREYSPEKSEQYKQRLLALTRKLRQC